MTLLTVDGLHVDLLGGQRRRVPVLQDISLTVDAGETLGIVGESGSGKSMLGLSLLRLLPRAARVRSGRIVLDGTDLLSLHERDLDSVRGSSVGAIFQDPVASLNPARHVGGQITEVLRRHGRVSRPEAAKEAIGLLDEVGIPAPERWMTAYPHQLSGGMCQRVTIAMAIASRPALLVADEPTTALDSRTEAQVLGLLDRLKSARQMAMVLISHDMRVVSRVTDRVAVMYAGEIVELAQTSRIFAAPQHPYTRALLESVPRVDDAGARRTRLQAIPGSPPRIGAWPDACRFAARCPYAGKDACTQEHPQLCEVAPQHWARTAHPLNAMEPMHA